MTITPDRLDDLDFDIPELDEIVQSEFVQPTGEELLAAIQESMADIMLGGVNTNPWEVHGTLIEDDVLQPVHGHICWCSPSRAAYIGHLMDWPEPITFTRWEPPLPKVMSKELVVINP